MYLLNFSFIAALILPVLTYSIEDICLFNSDFDLIFTTEDVQTSLGTMKINNYHSNVEDSKGIIYKFIYYSYPDEVQITLKEDESLLDTLLYSVAENLASKNESVIQYNSPQIYQGRPCQIFRIKSGQSFTKGRATFHKGTMLIQIVEAKEENFTSSVIQSYFDGLHLLQ